MLYQNTEKTIETPIDGTPLVGQIKGAIHMLTGDVKNGEEIIKKSTSNSIAALGGAIAGPAGVLIGRVVGDSVMTAVDSVENRKYKPRGIFAIEQNNNRENVDEAVDLASGIIFKMDSPTDNSGVSNQNIPSFHYVL